MVAPPLSESVNSSPNNKEGGVEVSCTKMGQGRLLEIITTH